VAKVDTGCVVVEV
jgi:hypothetical protein